MTYEEEYEKLETLKKDKKVYKLKLRNQTKATHNVFVQKNKTWIRVLDIVMIIAIILNFGAVIITNMLVVRDKPDVEFHEANEVQAEMNDYKAHDDGGALMRSLLLQVVLWVIIISVFISNRIMVVYFSFMITLDFVNDFGYLLGKMIWGL